MPASEVVNQLTVLEVARRLNISRSKVYQLIDSGHLPDFRIGGSVRVAEDQLAGFLESVRQGPFERASPTRRTRGTRKHLFDRDDSDKDETTVESEGSREPGELPLSRLFSFSILSQPLVAFFAASIMTAGSFARCW